MRVSNRRLYCEGEILTCGAWQKLRWRGSQVRGKASPLRAVVSNADAPAGWLCGQPALPPQL